MRFLIILISLLFSLNVFANGDSAVFRNNVFLETAGTSMFWSLNFERGLGVVKNFQFKGRVGFSFMNLYDFERKFNPNLTFPISLQVLYGKENHFIEVGTSLVTSTVSYFDADELAKKTDLNLSVGGIVGYRFHKKGTRMNYRIFYAPLWEYFQSYKHWGGASVGVSF
jgi:hypothetical protein